jgi:hypothetical protein
MNSMRWERLAPLTGIAAVILWVVGVILMNGVADQPDTDAPAADILSYFHDEGNTILVGAFLFMLGALFFLWFVGTLRAALLRAEGGVGRLAETAAYGGVATAICLLLIPAASYEAAQQDKNLTEGAAQAMLQLSDAFFYVAEFAAAILLFATAVVVLRTAVLPRWLSWASLVVGVLLWFPPLGWAALLFLVPLWTITLAVILYLRGGAAAPSAPVMP